jgi:hypothetical protein
MQLGIQLTNWKPWIQLPKPRTSDPERNERDLHEIKKNMMHALVYFAARQSTVTSPAGKARSISLCAYYSRTESALDKL